VPRTESTHGLYLAHRGRLVRYASGILGDASRAEDVVQDAWLIYDQLPEKHSVRDPLAYLHRMVRNLAINALRHVAHRQRITAEDFDSAVQTIAAPDPSAEADLIARQRLDHFMERLALLPERQQTAVRMHRMEGYKMREIADRLGVSIALVHSLIADALIRCADPADETE
jgi:RNA polymerase sigma-70 factor (ECF subfamily)